jgi:hypothetical protein
MNIVVSRFRKNVDWVYRLNGENNVMIYDKENPQNPYNVPLNKGNEASVFLKYVIDNYDNLSEFTFFTHDDEYAWHHTGSIISKFDEAVESGKLYYNINDKCVLGSIKSNKLYPELLEWYNEYIDKYIPLSSIPSDWTVDYRGSAQFLVHKSRILTLPKDFYQDLFTWILTTDMTNTKSGTFMEWCWHIFWDIYPNNTVGGNQGFPSHPIL